MNFQAFLNFQINERPEESRDLSKTTLFQKVTFHQLIISFRDLNFALDSFHTLFTQNGKLFLIPK
jgi:hypothetical protein